MRTRIGLILVPVLALAAGLSAPVAVAASPASPATRSAAAAANPGEGVPAFGHVFLIIGENTTYSHLTATNAPYLLGTIQPQAAWLTNYYAATHWSQANYVALVTGQFTACEQKDGGAACHQNVPNLFHQLDAAGLSWKVWLEAGTAKCDTGSGGSCTSNTPCPLTGFYTTGNPPILFDDIEGPGGVWSPATPSAGVPGQRRPRRDRHRGDVHLQRRPRHRPGGPLQHGHPQRLRRRRGELQAGQQPLHPVR